MNVRNELEALGKRESGKKPYISQAEYHNLCRKYGVDENTRSELLQWFNDLGVCFSYHEENGEELKNYRVLDPEWLTNAIYAIIVNGVKGMSSEGIITKSEIRDILGNPDEHPNKMTKPIKYAKAEQGYVLDVMRMFRLCYKMNDREYFVPALCPVNRPEGFIPTEGSFKEHIGFGFKFGFLTNSVVHRLMIDCREKNFGMPLFYSNGIRLDFDDEKMTIVVDMGLNTDKLIIDIFSQERAAPIKDKLRWLREHILNICKKLGTEITKELFVLYQDGSKAELSLGSLYGLHNKHILKHYINGDEDIVECDVEALMELLHPREIIDRADDLFRSEDRRRTGTYKDVLQDAYSGATPPPSGAKRYKLAFSVAGEQRKLIGEVFKKLVDKGYGEDEVFFYGEDDTELAVSSGNIAATNLYLNKSERVVAVLSPEYIEKPNTANMEWRVVFSRLGPMHDGEVCLLKYGDFEYHEKLGLIRGADFTKQIKGMSADEIADWIIKWTKKHPIEKA